MQVLGLEPRASMGCTDAVHRRHGAARGNGAVQPGWTPIGDLDVGCAVDNRLRQTPGLSRPDLRRVRPGDRRGKAGRFVQSVKPDGPHESSDGDSAFVCRRPGETIFSSVPPRRPRSDVFWAHLPVRRASTTPYRGAKIRCQREPHRPGHKLTGKVNRPAIHEWLSPPRTPRPWPLLIAGCFTVPSRGLTRVR